MFWGGMPSSADNGRFFSGSPREKKMRLGELPEDVREHVAKHAPRAIGTLGSACKSWRAVFVSNQRVVSNALAGLAGLAGYAMYVARFPRADTLRLGGAGLDLSLVTAPHLRSLSVVLGTFDPSTFVAMTQLTSLELSTNRLDHAGVATIAPRLGEMHALTRLAIRNNAVGLAATLALAPALARLTRLTDLDLSSNYIDADCLAALAPALECLASLATLRLNANFIGGAPRALTRLVTLETLELRGQMGRQ